MGIRKTFIRHSQGIVRWDTRHQKPEAGSRKQGRWVQEAGMGREADGTDEEEINREEDGL